MTKMMSVTYKLNCVRLGNVMRTDESRFAVQMEDNRVRVWREEDRRNRPQNITEDHEF